MTDLATVTDVADLLGLASEAVDPDQAAAMLALVIPVISY